VLQWPVAGDANAPEFGRDRNNNDTLTIDWEAVTFETPDGRKYTHVPLRV